jgi:hypothetical protein
MSRNRTGVVFADKPYNQSHQLQIGITNSNAVLIPVLHKRHHARRWEKSFFHTNRHMWLDLHARYIREGDE